MGWGLRILLGKGDSGKVYDSGGGVTFLPVIEGLINKGIGSKDWGGVL